MLKGAGLFLFAGLLFLTGCDGELNKDGWRLVWQDEFDGDQIDRSKWGYQTGGTGFGNNESQYYTKNPANAYVNNSRLVIKAIKEPYGGKPYTSAKLTTQGKADWTYGRFEIRARLPEGKGIWPAIWMMPTDMEKYGGWPSCGEIDIMEYLGHEKNKVYGTIHMGNPHTYKGGNLVLKEGDFSNSFHEFALEWTPTEMRWYVDGQLYHRDSEWFTQANGNSTKKAYPAPFDRPFYLQINLAVGGNWPGYPDDSTLFPQSFEIDYVRVYQPV